MSRIDRTGNVPKFGGTIHYVDGTNGSNSYSGLAPDEALLTITQATTNSVAGDAINVRAGTYNENALTMATNGLELWGEIGVLITNDTPGTCLTVTGNSCRIRGIKVMQSGQIGFNIDGAGCFLEHCIAEDCSIAYDIDGAETILEFCQDINATTTGFDIATAENTLYLCKSIAAGGASTGFHLSSSNANENLIYQCTSLGNGTAGYDIEAGAQYNVVAYCTSGGSDGRWVDDGSDNVWPMFAYEDNVDYMLTFDTTNGTSENLFRVYGTVEIVKLYGHVESALNADIGNSKFELYDSAASVDICTNEDISSAPVGSVFIKEGATNQAMTQISSANGAVSADRRGTNPFFLTQKAGQPTYIRATFAGDTDGQIHYHCVWRPITDTGYVVSA